MELNKFFVITGPSGVGKTSIAYRILDVNLPVLKVITTTTRAQRPSEQDGVDYNFITKESFLQKIENDEMFEWASYDDLYYGSQNKDVKSVIKQNKTPMWVVDVQGAQYFKDNFPNCVVIFIAPESLSALHDRLQSRGDDPADIKKRVALAEKEMKSSFAFDYQVINFDNQLDQAVEEVAQIIEQEL